MIHTYNVAGMTCSGCQAKVEKLISGLPGVISAKTDLAKGEVVVEMKSHIPTASLQEALAEHTKYVLSEKEVSMPMISLQEEPDPRSWLEIYKPIWLIFLFLFVVTLGIQWRSGGFDMMVWMRHFMAGFFLVFSFFKFLNLKEFADSYKMYDLPARYIPGYAVAYPFIEFGLGMLYLLNIEPFFTNCLTVLVMGVSLVGVVQSVMNKRKIKCACLGAVFNLPMSTVTIAEDSVMIAMSGSMLVQLFNL